MKTYKHTNTRTAERQSNRIATDQDNRIAKQLNGKSWNSYQFIYIITLVCLGLTVSNSALAQPKVVFKNGTDCPVEVKVFFYDTIAFAFGPTETFGVQPQSGGNVVIPQNHGVCFIAADFNINGADEIKLSGDDPNIPINVPLCHGIADYYPGECYEFRLFSEENGSYYLSVAQ